MKYSEKLRDPRWQRKRLEVMERDKFTCLACGDRESTLNVHHLQYHGEPWEAEMDELETLCETCHEWRTRWNNGQKNLATKFAMELDEILPDSQDGLVALTCINKAMLQARAVIANARSRGGVGAPWSADDAAETDRCLGKITRVVTRHLIESAGAGPLGRHIFNSQ